MIHPGWGHISLKIHPTVCLFSTYSKPLNYSELADNMRKSVGISNCLQINLFGKRLPIWRETLKEESTICSGLTTLKLKPRKHNARMLRIFWHISSDCYQFLKPHQKYISRPDASQLGTANALLKTTLNCIRLWPQPSWSCKPTAPLPINSIYTSQ